MLQFEDNFRTDQTDRILTHRRSHQGLYSNTAVELERQWDGPKTPEVEAESFDVVKTHVDSFGFPDEATELITLLSFFPGWVNMSEFQGMFVCPLRQLIARINEVAGYSRISITKKYLNEARTKFRYMIKYNHKR